MWSNACSPEPLARASAHQGQTLRAAGTGRPREGPSAGMIRVGTKQTPAWQSEAMRSAANLRRGRLRAEDEERPFASAPQATRESQKLMSRDLGHLNAAAPSSEQRMLTSLMLMCSGPASRT